MDYICPFVSFHFPISRKFVFYCNLIFSKLQEVYFSSLLICSRHIATTPMITPTTIPAPKAAHAILSSPLRFSEYSRLLMILCRQTIKNVPCFSHGEYSRISPESSQMHMMYQISEYQRKEKELQRMSIRAGRKTLVHRAAGNFPRHFSVSTMCRPLR